MKENGDDLKNLYQSKNYDTKERFCSYWHQIHEVLELNPANLLEIGIGNEFVSDYLRKKNIRVTTLDVYFELKPDIVGTVTKIPMLDKSFDTVMCCEVLEHLPYHSFPAALKEIFRVTRKYAVLSLPDVTTVYRVNIELPRMKPIKKLIPHPFHRSAPHEFDGEHYWEIGKTGHELERILSQIKKLNYKLLKTYRVFEFYYHRLFVLGKD